MQLENTKLHWNAFNKTKSLTLWEIHWDVRVVTWPPSEDSSSCSVQHSVYLLQNTLTGLPHGGPKTKALQGKMASWAHAPSWRFLDRFLKKPPGSVTVSAYEFRIDFWNSFLVSTSQSDNQELHSLWLSVRESRWRTKLNSSREKKRKKPGPHQQLMQQQVKTQRNAPCCKNPHHQEI